MEETLQSKEEAKRAIIGEWSWTKTTRQSRGTGLTTQTPESTGTTLHYKFTESSLVVLENNRKTDELTYQISYWGEGTNTQDPQLVITLLNKAGEETGRSILSIDKNSTCMLLIGSYNDAGGDMTFRKVK